MCKHRVGLDEATMEKCIRKQDPQHNVILKKIGAKIPFYRIIIVDSKNIGNRILQVILTASFYITVGEIQYRLNST